MSVQPLARQARSDDRGRHLVATAPIEKGQLIFCERPMVALQSTGNIHSGVLVCQYCMSFCGRPEQALKVAGDPSTLHDVTTQASTQETDGEGGEYAMIACRNKCGHVYCSKECQIDDWEWGGHKELCTGDISDPEHPLIKFKQHAVSSNEIFLLIAKWLTRIHNHNLPYQEDDWQNSHPYTDFSMNPWWDVATLPLKNEPMGFTEAVALEKACRQLCSESHELLQEAWPQHQSSPWLTPLGMSRLIGSLEQNCMGIRRKHALRRAVMEDSELRHACHGEIIQCLERAGMIGGDDEEDEENEETKELEDVVSPSEDASENGDENEEEGLLKPNEEWDYTFDEIAEFLSNLSTPLNIGSDDEWDDILLPMDGTAHYSFAEKMNHSCEPNVVLLYKTRGWGKDHPLVAYCVAMRDIAAGEELTLSYIVSDDPYDVRQKALANYDFVCTCPKCEREAGNSTSAEVPGNAGVEDSPDVEEDDLFGSDDDDDDEHNEKEKPDEEETGEEGDDEDGLGGETKLQNAGERLESIQNQSIYLAVPLKYLAPISNYAIHLASSLTKAIEANPEGSNDEQVIQKLLSRCSMGVQSRDYSLCRLVGLDLESYLYGSLKSKGSFPTTVHRESYWCACVTATIGFAQEGSFLVAMKYLDKAVILGQKRDELESLFSYVELHASQMAATPCPPAIQCKIPDFSDPEMVRDLSSKGLSSPIQHSVEEVTCSPAEFSELVKNRHDPVVLRRLGAEWPAAKKWREMDVLARSFGHRLVPIEVGSMDSGMKEKLVEFRSFVADYLADSAKKQCWSFDDATSSTSKIGYLAQHSLLDQIPELYQDVDKKPCGIEPTHVYTWIGTGGTRTPLHFDSYDNLFVQVVGAKYVRLYGADKTPRLYVSQDKGYGLQGNMSEVNCEMEDFARHPSAKECEYTEVLLLPGDCLYIPSRCWHYVRSLSTSISVNYWF